MKTACYVTVKRDNANAQIYCRSAGMELYAVTTAYEYAGILTYAQIVYPFGVGALMQINGQYDSTDEKWYVFNPTRKPLLSGTVTGSYTSGNDCLAVSARSTGYIVNTLNCSTTSTYFCEYI